MAEMSEPPHNPPHSSGLPAEARGEREHLRLSGLDAVLAFQVFMVADWLAVSTCYLPSADQGSVLSQHASISSRWNQTSPTSFASLLSHQLNISMIVIISVIMYIKETYVK